jgi:hypothetical protein
VVKIYVRPQDSQVLVEYQLPLESMICLINLLRLVTMTNLNICKVYKILEKDIRIWMIGIGVHKFLHGSFVGTGRLRYMGNKLNTRNKI